MTNGYLHDLLVKLGFSDFSARTGEFILEKPVRILFTLTTAWIIIRLASKAMRRFALTLTRRAPSRLLGARMEQRAQTITDALVSLLKVVVWAIAGLIILDVLGVDLAPLLAGAGIAGI